MTNWYLSCSDVAFLNIMTSLDPKISRVGQWKEALCDRQTRVRRYGGWAFDDDLSQQIMFVVKFIGRLSVCNGLLGSCA